jgi:hypothetical protein
MAASLKQKEITAALNSFYQKPVAMISMELLLSLGLVIFLAVFAIQPTLLTMSNLIQERNEKIELLDKLEKKADALNSAHQLYQQAQAKLPQLDEAVPPTPQLMRSFLILEKLATENNIIIEAAGSSVVPSEEPVTDPKIKLQRVDRDISITVTGEYLDIRSFIQALQNSRRSFVIKTVIFSLQENRGEKKLSVRIVVSAPFIGVPQK